MSTQIFHGEYKKNAHQALFTEIQNASLKQSQVHRHSATELSVAEIEHLLGSTNLFGTTKLIVIDGLHSLPKSKKKDQMINLASMATETDLILFESKKLTSTQLKKFPFAIIREFSIPSAIFTWLDHIHEKPTKCIPLFQTAAQQEDIEFCFSMLIRQIRLLLLIRSGATPKENPYVLRKISNQSKSFTIEKLTKYHSKLTETDYKHKTGQLGVTLKQAIEQLMIES